MTGIGTLFLIVRRSLRQHLLSTLVTILSAALGSGLVMATFAVAKQSRAAFAGGPVGFDAVLGARGSAEQLVLNTVFHLETSPGNIPWSMYREIAANPSVTLAIPYALGDNYLGYRVVGTTTDLFDEFELTRGQRFEIRPGGRAFDPSLREAVIGSTVARETGLNVRGTFKPFHGLAYDGRDQHQEEYTVVGVLEPTGSPSDRVIWIPIDGVFRMEGDVLRGTGEAFRPSDGFEIPDEAKEVSAVMLKLSSPRAGVTLGLLVNKQGKVATLAWPIGKVMADLFRKLGWVNRVLELVAFLVLAGSAAPILASLYNAMNERRREFAILRTLGAKKRTVFSAIVLEAATISTLGALLGFAVYAAILATAATIVKAQTGVVLDGLAYHPAFVWTPIGMILLGALAGLLPAAKAYSTDVASNLVPSS